MIAVIDYGMGNLGSIQKAFEKIGAESVVSADRAAIKAASALVLPGVGAFGYAMANLREAGLMGSIHRAFREGKPFLGICLGMQLLFEASEEMGTHQGLGIFKGRVKKFEVDLKVPHMGWNQIHIQQPNSLLNGVADGSYVYFVHSYYVEPVNLGIILASTDYGIDYASVIGRGAIYGIQFHPEKSQDVGLRILRNFAAMGE